MSSSSSLAHNTHIGREKQPSSLPSLHENRGEGPLGLLLSSTTISQEKQRAYRGQGPALHVVGEPLSCPHGRGLPLQGGRLPRFQGGGLAPVPQLEGDGAKGLRCVCVSIVRLDRVGGGVGMD